MGNFSSIYRRLLSRKEDVRILMAGLDAAGKTSIVYKLKVGKFVTTIPTIGLNVETVEYKNIRFTVLDVGGQEKVRPLWRHYYKGTRALIFVVDSNDKERLSEAQYELQLMLNAEELKDAAVLVFANKQVPFSYRKSTQAHNSNPLDKIFPICIEQDLPNAMHPDAIAKRLGLSSPNTQRPWHIQESSATTGEGLFEGLDWLSSNLGGGKSK